MNLKISPSDIKTLIEGHSEQDTERIIFEEPAELIQAFSKFKRYGNGELLENLYQLETEIVDVYIVLEMIKTICGISNERV